MWALRAAGLVSDEYHKLLWRVFDKKASLPSQVACRYIFSETPIEARITLKQLGPPVTSLKIELDDADVAKKIHAKLAHYSVENRGLLVAERERAALWARVNEILIAGGTSVDQVNRNGAMLNRSTLQSLMHLAEEVEHPRQGEIIWIFLKPVIAKADREFVAQWLVKFFAAERDPSERAQIGVNLDKFAVPGLADDLIRLLLDSRYGYSRAGLCGALVKTKDARAADVIASVIDEPELTRWALAALGKLKATNHVEAARKFLEHPDADVRREAKKTMKKLGFPVETPPSPVHLVKRWRSVPKDLEEWSTNLDFDDLTSILEALAKSVESGFAPREIAEVLAVVEELEHDETKAFCFPITEAGQKCELWLVVFMDDIDSPNLEIHGSPELILKLKEALPERD